MRSCEQPLQSSSIALSGAWVRHQLILREQTDGLDCRRACLGDRLRDILRVPGIRRKGIRPPSGTLHGRSLRMSLGEEVVGIDAGCQHGSKCFCTVSDSGSMAVARHNHIRIPSRICLLSRRSTPCTRSCPFGLRNDFSDLTFDVVYIVLFHGSSVELVEVLPRGTNVDIEDSHVYIRIFITDQHRHALQCTYSRSWSSSSFLWYLHNGFPRTG